MNRRRSDPRTWRRELAYQAGRAACLELISAGLS